MTPGLLLAALLLLAAPAATGVLFVVLEDFDDGTVALASWPGEDADPNGWVLDPAQGRNGSPYGLRLTGNTWKAETMAPHHLDSASRWSVSAKVIQTGELQGFGIADSAHALFFAFAGTEEADPDTWVTVHQGAFSTGVWNSYTLPVGEEWLTRYGYLPAVTRLIYINDRDTDPTADIVFDDIRDVTGDQPRAPLVQISWTLGPVVRTDGITTVDVHFTSQVTDPDGAPHTYSWSFGDGAGSTASNPVHTYTCTDDHEYTVLLQVRDQTNRWGRAVCRVVVDPGPGTLPVRMNFVGDVMLARGYEVPGGIIPTFGVEAIFAPTRPLLGDAADITVANLECPLTQSGSPHPTKPIVFRGSPANAAGLAWAGIDVVTIANNHILDYGLPGIDETRSVLAAQGIAYSGAGADMHEADRPLFVSRSGLTIAFLASSDRTGQYNNYQPFLQAGEGKPGFSELTPYRAATSIAAVRPLADAVIMEMHSGSEYSTAPDAESAGVPPPPAPAAADRDIRRGAIDAGADLVICHHPHILHGVEVYRGRVIAHSLGNFAFDLGYAETFPSAILSASLDTGGFRDVRLLPVFIDDYIPRPAAGELGRHILNDLAMKSRELGTVLLVDPDSATAAVVLDTTLLIARDRLRTTSAPLRVEGSYRVSAPVPLVRDGSVRDIPSITPAGTWYYRTGRDLVWFGSFESDVTSAWALDDADETIDSATAHNGTKSLRQRRTTGSGELVTRLDRRVPAGTGAAEYTVYGWMRTAGARNARLRASFWSSRTGGGEAGSAEPPAMVQGTTGWTFLYGNTAGPVTAAFVDLEARSSGPLSGTGDTWSDDAGVILWSAWRVWTPTETLPVPSDTRWLQFRTTAPVSSVQPEWTERTFLDAADPAQISVALHEGWNIISNPLAPSDTTPAVSALYPGALRGTAYAFSGAAGYQPATALQPGAGYWARFPEGGIRVLQGPPVDVETVQIRRGWNIVGSVSSAADTGAVVTVPAGLVASLFYSYSPGYFPAEQILPGSGVWVKCSADGLLILRGTALRRTQVHGSGAPPGRTGTLTFRDASGFTQTLLFRTSADSMQGDRLFREMPPAPPVGAPDIRYEHGGILAVPGTDTQDHVIRMAGLRYPLTVAWEHQGPGNAVLEAAGRPRALPGRGTITLPSDPGRLVLRLSAGAQPTEFSLDPFYPNPFNAGSRASVRIPVASRVRAVLYDLLGREVDVLTDGDAGPGVVPLYFSGAAHASGVYFCRVTARPLAGGAPMTAVRKVALIR